MPEIKTIQWTHCVCRAVPKSSNSDEDPEYAEVEFDRKIPSTVRYTFKS